MNWKIVMPLLFSGFLVFAGFYSWDANACCDWVMPGAMPQAYYDVVKSEIDANRHIPKNYQFENSQKENTVKDLPLIYSEGKDLSCVPKLITIDEILQETDRYTKFYVQSTSATGEMGYGESGCLVRITTLDGEYNMVFAEIQTSSSSSAKKFFTDSRQAWSQNPDFSLNDEDGSSFSFMSYDGNSKYLYTDFSIKDEFVIMTGVEKTYDDDSKYYRIFDCVQCLATKALKNVNPQYISKWTETDGYVRFANCDNLLINPYEVDNLSSKSLKFRTGQYPSDFLNDGLLKTVDYACEINFISPDYRNPSHVMNAMHFIFDSEHSAQNVYHEITDSANAYDVTVRNLGINDNSILLESDTGGGALLLEKNQLLFMMSTPKPYSILDVNDYETILQTAAKKINPQIRTAMAQEPENEPSPKCSAGTELVNGVCQVIKSDTPTDGGGCLIATAAYGTELAPQVQFLREVRDNTVMSTASGAAFMTGFNQLYYSFSPTIADMQRENPMFQEAVRAFITPMVSTLSIMTLAEDGSEVEVLALGLSVIALNIGMYVAAPVGMIILLQKSRKTS